MEIKDLEKPIKLTVTIENGKKIKMRRSYCNSNYDRNELLNLLPIELYNQIIEVWGNEATVADLPDPRVHAEWMSK